MSPLHLGLTPVQDLMQGPEDRAESSPSSESLCTQLLPPPHRHKDMDEQSSSVAAIHWYGCAGY